MQRTYQLGAMTITQQSFIILVVGTSISIALMIAALLNAHKPYLAVSSMFLALVLFGATCYGAYAANCVIVGNCKVLAWFLVGVNCLMFLNITITVSAILATGNKNLVKHK